MHRLSLRCLGHLRNSCFPCFDIFPRQVLVGSHESRITHLLW